MRVAIVGLLVGTALTTVAALGLYVGSVFFSSVAFAAGVDTYPALIFDRKEFYSSPDYVEVSGTLTGEGVGYPNNTMNISCTKVSGECLISEMDQIGANLLGRLAAPNAFSILTWDDNGVVEAADTFGCIHTTIAINLSTQRVTYAEDPVNVQLPMCKDMDTNTYVWTLEDPPFWHQK